MKLTDAHGILGGESAAITVRHLVRGVPQGLGLEDVDPRERDGPREHPHRSESLDESLRVDQHKPLDALGMRRGKVDGRRSSQGRSHERDGTADLLLPERVEVRALRLGGVVSDARVARVGESPSEEVHGVGLGALVQQREQAAVLETRAVEAVDEDERRDILATLGRGGADDAGHHGLVPAGHGDRDLSCLLGHLHRGGFLQGGDLIGEEARKFAARRRSHRDDGATNVAGAPGRADRGTEAGGAGREVHEIRSRDRKLKIFVVARGGNQQRAFLLLHRS